MKILVIEDEQIAIDILDIIFHKAKIEYDYSMNGSDGICFALNYKYDLILVDLMLPDISGYEVIKRIRSNGIDTPIIILSALADSNNVITGLNSGADDYLCKPFDSDILISKISAIVRRAANSSTSKITLKNGLILDINSKTVYYKENKLSLSQTEYKILELLILNKGRILSKNDILERLYREQDEPEVNSIDTYMYRVRKAIADEVGNNDIIQNVYGSGYFIREELPA